jgi:hypothetical protein
MRCPSSTARITRRPATSELIVINVPLTGRHQCKRGAERRATTPPQSTPEAEVRTSRGTRMNTRVALGRLSVTGDATLAVCSRSSTERFSMAMRLFLVLLEAAACVGAALLSSGVIAPYCSRVIANISFRASENISVEAAGLNASGLHSRPRSSAAAPETQADTAGHSRYCAFFGRGFDADRYNLRYTVVFLPVVGNCPGKCFRRLT